MPTTSKENSQPQTQLEQYTNDQDALVEKRASLRMALLEPHHLARIGKQYPKALRKRTGVKRTAGHSKEIQYDIYTCHAVCSAFLHLHNIDLAYCVAFLRIVGYVVWYIWLFLVAVYHIP